MQSPVLPWFVLFFLLLLEQYKLPLRITIIFQQRAPRHQILWKTNSIKTTFYNIGTFFLKFLADTCPFLGPLVPLFWISGDVSSGFQSQSGLLYSHCGGERNVHSPRSTSGATLVNLLVAGAAGPVPTYCCRGEVTGIRTHALRISVSQTLYQLS